MKPQLWYQATFYSSTYTGSKAFLWLGDNEADLNGDLTNMYWLPISARKKTAFAFPQMLVNREFNR